MKKLIRITCIIMAIVLLFAVPVYAEEVSTWSSSYIAIFDSYLWKISDNQFQVWFDITGMGMMEELGVSQIKVQRRASPNDEWVTFKTYLPSSYPQMICKNTGSHVDCVTYTGTPGYYYRAVVTFYAKNSKGIGKIVDYAETILL